MTPADDLVAIARDSLARLARLAGESVASATDTELVGRVVALEEVQRVLTAAQVAAAAEVEARSAHELGDAGLSYRLGHRRGRDLLAQLTRASAGDIARRLAVGRATRPSSDLLGAPQPPRRPHLAAALESGDVGIDAALAIDRALAEAERADPEPDAVRAAEGELVRSAGECPADYVRDEARVWREWLDPDGIEPREELIHERRRVRLGRERHGLTPISGDLDQELGALLRSAFTESLGGDAAPRFLAADDAAPQLDCDDGTVIRADDPRTREQRQHDVLLGLLTAGSRATVDDLGGGASRPLATVMATIALDDLVAVRGGGTLSDVDDPVSAETIAALACDSGFRISVTDGAGCPLDESPRLRFFTATQRRALAIRDGGCIWPGCTAPAASCHSHHVVFYSRGGRATVDNGVLLCPAHHRMLHHSDIEIRMVAGRPRLVAPPGYRLGRMSVRSRPPRRPQSTADVRDPIPRSRTG
ncbi:DUF222 domain-containing protein [Galbitalea sp. SE-J8]|uniref:HNH endonuclease signature motif containing protein n=1 Tax=Galbitalea sp. SE-J8 TaxID=3054952 RepID=UPI00259CE848|nr:HNH endonuclease signature motif containing protein [Galbitalea sp. SE-J8]MDM4763827.1 DUF222 domain-containing protein [Galbitalea sp. SE-J8]